MAKSKFLVSSISCVLGSVHTERIAIAMPKKLVEYIFLTLADPRGRQGLAPSPGGQNSFIFMEFLTKNLQNNLNLRVGAPPLENPGSATA